MNYQVIKPCEKLKGIISHFWIGSWDSNSEVPNHIYYIAASSTTSFNFAFKNSDDNAELLFSVVEGHNYKPKQLRLGRYAHLLCVSIYSHAIPFLFKISPIELSNQFYTLDTFLGRDGKLLNERIALAKNDYQRINILTDFFLDNLKDCYIEDGLMNQAVNIIKQYQGQIQIQNLANESNLSLRQFLRRFREYSGFSPKTFARIIRFESLVESYSDSSSLTDLSYSKGYFDQSHQNHEFKEFSGFNHKEFWKILDDNN